MTNHVAPHLLKRREIAARYGVGTRTVDRWVKERRIPYIRIGPRCVRFCPERCDAALQLFEVEAATAGMRQIL